MVNALVNQDLGQWLRGISSRPRCEYRLKRSLASQDLHP